MAQALPLNNEDPTQGDHEDGYTGTIKKRPLVTAAPSNITTRLQAQVMQAASSPVSSTPLQSPSKENFPPMNQVGGGLENESYMTTPFVDSVGIQLIAKRVEPRMPDIEGDISHVGLIAALDRFDELIEYYNSELSSEKGVDQSLTHKFKRLYARANRSRLIAAEREDNDTLMRCTDIMAKIEGLKLKLSMANFNSTENASALQGFDSFDFFKAASRLPSSNTHAKIIAELSRKLSEMEHVVPAINILTEQMTSLNKQGVGNDGHNNRGNNPQQLQSISNAQANLENRMGAVESSIPEIEELSNRVSIVETALSTVNNDLDGHTSDLEAVKKFQCQFTTEFSNYKASMSKDIKDLQVCVEALFNNSTQRRVVQSPTYLLTDENVIQDERTHEWVRSQNQSVENTVRNPRVPEPQNRPTPAPRQSIRTIDQTGVFSNHSLPPNPRSENAFEARDQDGNNPRYQDESETRNQNGADTRNRSGLEARNLDASRTRNHDGYEDRGQGLPLSSGQSDQCFRAQGEAMVRDQHESAREENSRHITQYVHQNRFPERNTHSLLHGNQINNNAPPSRIVEGRNYLGDEAASQSLNSSSGRLNRGLIRQMNALGRLLSPRPCQSLDKATLQDVYKNVIPTVNSERKELQRMLRDYTKLRHCDDDLIEKIEDVLDNADDWCASMRLIYHNKGHHKKSQNGKLYETLPKFHPESEIDIFEFIRRFENLTADYEIPAEQAELFYSKYLSDSLQDEVVMVKENYDRMKTILMHRYGDIRIITDNILTPVTNEKVPSHGDVKSKLNYFRKLQSALQKVSKLLENPDISREETQAYIYSHDFLKRILHLIPEETMNYYVESMSNLNQDITRVRGVVAFRTILQCVNKFYERYDSMARNTDLYTTEISAKSRKDKSKTMKYANHADSRNHAESCSENEAEVLSKPASSQNVLFQESKKGTEKKNEKPVLKKPFPCTLTGHKHGVAECAEFFMQSPKERAEQRKSFKFKHCYLCLQSSNNCTSKSCANVDKIPKALICEHCWKASKDMKRACYSVLFCFNETHTKPSNTDILKALEDYVPGFKRNLLNSPVTLAGHLHILAGTKIKPDTVSMSSPANPSQPAPVFNTWSGSQDTPHDADKIDEIDEDNIGVMQTLSLNGHKVLTLFDRGANQHLISGPLAEELGIKVINQQQSSVGVISGKQLWTGYGTYELYLGPTTVGKYYQLKANGIKEITSTFPEYDLAEVNTEVKEKSDVSASTILPPSIGGDSIKLLIGLKRTDLEPVCVFSLPSGVGLYKSPFRDIHGSIYCYGGPHRVFSDVNKKVCGNINHFYSYFAQLINQYRSSPYLSICPNFEPEIVDSGHGICFEKEPEITYSFQSSSGQGFSPNPLTKCDIEELGQEVNENDIDTRMCPEAHCVCPTITWALKAKIPLTKQKSFIDEEDKDDVINYRCEKCMKCKCASSSTARMMSLTERIEQEAIEKSVSVNLTEKAVYVDLPFTKPPGEFLTTKHGSDDNYSQALRVYKSQCRLPEEKKDCIRKVHADLVSKGFLKKLCDLPPEHQKLIKDAPFRHYMPWRTVNKDSASTPLRIVVDPSMSGLNLILAKGENKIKRMNDIIMRSRTKKFLWSSDISKLYNCLKLKPSSYAYQLFLFHNDLDANSDPDIYIMLVAWYGVASSSNQAIFAIEELARLQKDDYPLAFEVLSEDIFVDDILSGSDDNDERSKQVTEVDHVLDSGGFKVKFVILSGEPTDESNVKVLGYTWNPVSDVLGPGFQEINFNKKKRGLKNPNPFPISTPDDVSKLMTTTQLTRRAVISKIAELWEPIGLWEPYKLQLKLAAQTLNGFGWDSPLPKEAQQFWSEKFKEFLQVPNLKISRYIFPSESLHAEADIRLICVSDAAANAGGAAIYAGRKVQGSLYSCQLLTSKSKLMSQTIPRNELEAIRLGANLAADVKNAIGDTVKEVLFFTDSSIALSWCHNTKKKLRLFVLNRVSEIRRVITSTTGKSDIPLYHIDGKLNIADLLTKPNSLKPDDLQPESTWMSGNSWMKLHFDKMPIMRFSDIQLSAQQDMEVNEECFPEMIFPEDDTPPKHSLSLLKGGKGSLPLVDIIYHGYSRSLEIMANVIHFTRILQHKSHKKKGVEMSSLCNHCKAVSDSGGIEKEHRKTLIADAKNYFLKQESSVMLSTLPKQKLDKLKNIDGILYTATRLPEDTKVCSHDLDFDVFFDNTSIKGKLPVVRADSDFLFALLIHVHHKVRKHSGNDITLREITKTVFPIGNTRKVIQEVRKNCPRCRLIVKKTLELEMGNHPESRLQIAPAFYHCMADICYGFKGKPHKTARTNVKIYALVIVCLLTSATSILALEGLETQDVVIALERHSALHGVPATIFVDQGTQLVSLDKTSMNLRDANHQLRESLGFEIVPSVAKSHEERGRVERKIRTLRDMLNKTAVNTDIAMTALQWETIFSKMASEIDDIPIARADKAPNTDIGWQLLTPNRLKLGRSNNRAIEGPMSLSPDTGPVQLLKRVHDIQTYWYQLLLDRLHHLIPKPDKWTTTDEIKEGDVIVLKLLDNPNAKLEKWIIARVVEVQSGGRRILCSYPHKLPNGSTRMTTIIRSPRDICIISAATDVQLNSREFFNRIKKVA